MTKKIEEIQMTNAELSELPEYSCSLPAMTTIGNRWKRNTTFGRQSYSPDGPWILGEYIAINRDAPGRVAIRWRKIVLVEADDLIFVHGCISPGCERLVEIDDEPWCFVHSPDEGSSVTGYSASKGIDSYEVIDILVNELDKHGHGDFHYDSPGYRNLDVLAALAVGRAWLDANKKDSETRSSHNYISTACQHPSHDKNRLTCKFCISKCMCPCHNIKTDLKGDDNND